MGRRYDDRRWIQNPDGSFSRREQEVQQPTLELQAQPQLEVNATGAAIALAKELGVDLSKISGSGAGGKITKPDVENAAA